MGLKLPMRVQTSGAGFFFLVQATPFQGVGYDLKKTSLTAH